MCGWTHDNLKALRKKMEKKGIQQGGILNTLSENTALYDFLVEKTTNVKEREI